MPSVAREINKRYEDIQKLKKKISKYEDYRQAQYDLHGDDLIVTFERFDKLEYERRRLDMKAITNS